MSPAARAEINRANATLSTGPLTDAGKQRSRMNAVRHGLTGTRMLLQAHEHEAYQRLTQSLTSELKPAGAMEIQLVGRIIDCHTRLNRIAAMENNILNFSLIENTSAAPHDDETECMAAQSRALLEHENSFEKLGRYEGRIARQLLTYTKEFERLHAERLQRESAERIVARRLSASTRQAADTKCPTPALASFGRTPSAPFADVPTTPTPVPICPLPEAA